MSICELTVPEAREISGHNQTAKYGTLKLVPATLITRYACTVAGNAPPEPAVALAAVVAPNPT
jgi:hypothetical protein